MRAHPRLRRPLVAVVGTAVALGVGAAPAAARLPVNPIVKAAAKTDRVKGERLLVTVLVSQGTKRQETHGVGKFDAASRSGRFRFVSSNGSVLEQIVNGGSLYLRSPEIQKELPAGKQWLRVNLKAASSRFDLTSLTQIGGQGDSTRFLRAAGSDQRVIGHNVVGGSRTTHWRVTIDFTKLPVLARTPAEKRQAARLAAGLARALGTTHFPLDVWIDGAGFVRKERYTLALKVGPTSKDRVRLTSVVELRNFGPKKPVAAPPASLVADAPKSGKTV